MVLIYDTTPAELKSAHFDLIQQECQEIRKALLGLSKILVPFGMDLFVTGEPANHRRPGKKPNASASVWDKYKRAKKLPELYSEKLSRLACHIVHPARLPEGSGEFRFFIIHPVNMQLTAHEYFDARQDMLAASSLPGRQASFIRTMTDEILEDLSDTFS